MSFSSNVKQELCRLPISRRQEAAAELYGILLYCNAFTAELIRITTESRDLADRLPRLMKKVAGFSFDQEPEAEETGKLVFTVDSQEKIHKIFAQFGLSAAKDVRLQFYGQASPSAPFHTVGSFHEVSTIIAQKMRSTSSMTLSNRSVQLSISRSSVTIFSNPCPH